MHVYASVSLNVKMLKELQSRVMPSVRPASGWSYWLSYAIQFFGLGADQKQLLFTGPVSASAV